MTPDEIASYGDKFTFEDVVERTNKGLESGYSNETVDDIIEELARDEYFGNPYEMIEAVDAGPNTFALGNEDIGYSIFVDGKRIENKLPQGYHGDPTPYNNIEARIQLRQAMADEGYDYFRLEGEEGIYDNIQYKEYIDGNLPGGKNYREVVFNWENAPKGVGSFDHFEDENQIAHALVRDRKLSDGTDSLHIDELQSDLHKEGSRYGYELTPKQIKNQAESINDSLKDTSYSFEQTGTMFGIKKPNPNVEYTFVDGHDFIDDHLIEKALHDINSAIKIRKKEKTGKSTILGIRGPSRTESVKSFINDGYYVDKLLDKSGNIKSQDEINKLSIDFSSQELNDYNLYKESYDLIRDIGLDKTKEISAKLKAINNQSAVPNYPFKDDWYNMGIKSLLMDAVDEGKDAISISTSAIMKDRYSSQYHKFYEMLYDKKIPSSMKKIANKYGGEFRKGSLDMNDTFLDSGIPKTDKGLYDANTIKITPKMREKILQEGVQTFASGGVIGNLPSRVAKI